MPAKRQHTDADIAMLAAQFRETWSDGQVIRSWLRIHAEELRRLVRREDWAWVNIGRAMSLAGIAYRTGKPWTGEHLRRALVKACATQKKESSQQGSAQKAVAPSEGAGATPPPANGEPEFRIVRRRPAPQDAVGENGTTLSKGEP